jgi:hypothetical protein
MTDPIHTERPSGQQPYDVISLREYFTLWVTRLEKDMDGRFKASDEAVKAALAAQKELTATAFASSEKAIVKAEEAQREYNVRSNEFRGQLDDQAKLLITRTEAISRFETIDKRGEETKLRHDAEIASLRAEIGNLRESRSEGVGSNISLRDSRTQGNIDTSRMITIIIAAVGISVGIIEFLLRSQ